jgi:tight adherence protein C
MQASLPVLSMTAFLAVFGSICVAGFVVFVRASGNRRRALERLRNLGDDEAQPQAAVARADMRSLAWSALLKLGRLMAPKEEERQASRKKLLYQAGIYGPQALRIFAGAQFTLLIGLPLMTIALPYALGLLSLRWALAASVVVGSAGMVAPNAWLRSWARKRQRQLRHGLPDALDMLVLCLEGGVGLTAAFQRINAEIHEVHPVLGGELNIVEREIQLGLPAGQALHKMAERCGLADMRELACILLQSERFGTSLVKAVRTYAESWRLERQNQAEEQAHKTAVKILFPTLLCIFPAIFLVLLGPAAFQIARLFDR